MSNAKRNAAEVLIHELDDNITIARQRIASPRPHDWPAYERERARLSRVAIRAVRAATKTGAAK